MPRSKLRRAPFAFVSLTLLLATVACGSDEIIGSGRSPEGFPVLSTAHPPTCDGLSSRLRACGVLTEGAFACEEPTTDVHRCELGCLTGASCTLLWDFQCRSRPPVIGRCLSQCGAFTCASGELIELDWECDGADDCEDASDEVDCPTFQCASGELIPERNRCNWATNCLDNSDELGCVGFDCASGGSIPPEGRCDGVAECPDGSDEAGCPGLVCTSTGEILPADWRCDQIHDCLDGSDEIGCAELLCR